MNEYNQQHESAETFLSGNDAIKFSGPLNRPATEMEIDELVNFYTKTVNHFTGNSTINVPDDKVRQIALRREKALLAKELQLTTSVMDLVRMQTQIFHIYNLKISRTSVTAKYLLINGFTRIIKRNGILKEMQATDEILFQL